MTNGTNNHIDTELERMIHPQDDILSADELEAQRNLLASKEVVYAERNLQAATTLEEQKKAEPAKDKNILLYTILSIAATVLVTLLFVWPHDDGTTTRITAIKTTLPKGMVYRADKTDKDIKIITDKGERIKIPASYNNGIDMRHTRIQAQSMTITIPKGKSYHIELADGSNVYMYADSKLSFPTTFIGEKRQVELTGKAYFDVKHMEGVPFIIKTSKMSTTVLGTQFFVEADKGYDSRVTLINGKVQVETKNDKKIIEPGQQTQVKGDGTMTVAAADIDYYTNWRDGFFYYDNVELRDVLSDIGREYNCTVIINDPKLQHYKVHFTAERSKPVEDIIYILNQLGHFKIRLHGNSLIVGY